MRVRRLCLSDDREQRREMLERTWMATLEVLSTDHHAGLRLGPPLSADRHFVQIVLDEFESVAARFPILFTKHPETGAFYAGALLGLKPGENIAAGSGDGAAVDRLFDLVRQGFFISGDHIAIDPAHTRFVRAGGQPVFDDGGTPAVALRRVQSALSQLHAGLPQTEQFLKRLLARKLVEPIDLSFRFDDGERLALEGLYTISRDALAELDDAAVIDLFRQGDLALAHAVLGSQHHISRLAHLRNDRLVGG
ncbi:SapC [compost metagenome]|jgi:SapC